VAKKPFSGFVICGFSFIGKQPACFRFFLTPVQIVVAKGYGQDLIFQQETSSPLLCFGADIGQVLPVEITLMVVIKRLVKLV